MAVFGGVFQGVGNQIRKYFAEFVRIDGNDHPARRRACHAYGDSLFAGVAGESGHHAFDQGENVLPADRKRQRIVLDAAQTEGLVDEFEQPLDVVVNQIDQFVQAFFVLYVG